MSSIISTVIGPGKLHVRLSSHNKTHTPRGRAKRSGSFCNISSAIRSTRCCLPDHTNHFAKHRRVMSITPTSVRHIPLISKHKTERQSRSHPAWIACGSRPTHIEINDVPSRFNQGKVSPLEHQWNSDGIERREEVKHVAGPRKLRSCHSLAHFVLHRDLPLLRRKEKPHLDLVWISRMIVRRLPKSNLKHVQMTHQFSPVANLLVLSPTAASKHCSC